MIKQYKLRELNKSPRLHKESFFLVYDVMEFLEKFIDAAIEAGADEDKLMGVVSDKPKDIECKCEPKLSIMSYDRKPCGLNCVYIRNSFSKGQ